MTNIPLPEYTRYNHFDQMCQGMEWIKVPTQLGDRRSSSGGRPRDEMVKSKV